MQVEAYLASQVLRVACKAEVAAGGCACAKYHPSSQIESWDLRDVRAPQLAQSLLVQTAKALSGYSGPRNSSVYGQNSFLKCSAEGFTHCCLGHPVVNARPASICSVHDKVLSMSNNLAMLGREQNQMHIHQLRGRPASTCASEMGCHVALSRGRGRC